MVAHWAGITVLSIAALFTSSTLIIQRAFYRQPVE
jgi:hypothetical protein